MTRKGYLVLQKTVSVSIFLGGLLLCKLEQVMFARPAHNQPIVNVNILHITLELNRLLDEPLFIPSLSNFHPALHILRTPPNFITFLFTPVALSCASLHC
jgi:hypothetical protein